MVISTILTFLLFIISLTNLYSVELLSDFLPSSKFTSDSHSRISNTFAETDFEPLVLDNNCYESDFILLLLQASDIIC
jgi:hypothetical protein